MVTHELTVFSDGRVDGSVSARNGDYKSHTLHFVLAEGLTGASAKLMVWNPGADKATVYDTVKGDGSCTGQDVTVTPVLWSGPGRVRLQLELLNSAGDVVWQSRRFVAVVEDGIPDDAVDPPGIVRSAEIDGLTIAGGAAVYRCSVSSKTAKYAYIREFPQETAATALNSVEITATPKSKTASMTLKYTNGQNAGQTSGVDTATGAHTFSGVNLASDSAILTVADGKLKRDYRISARITGNYRKKVSVYFALRTYLAEQWLNGSTTYYDYASNGFGSSDDLSDAEWDEADTARSGIAAWNTPNAPESIDAATNRPIFAQNSYVAIEMDADAKVMDVLTTFISQKSGMAQTGAGADCVSEIAYNGNALGEFTCGIGSGWLYMTRSGRTNGAEVLYGAGAALDEIRDGMYIDWCYTCANGADLGYTITN